MALSKFAVGCPNCGTIDPVGGFRKQNISRGQRPWCVHCAREYERKKYAQGRIDGLGRYQMYYAANKEQIAEKKRVKHYGITDAEFAAMVEACGGKCKLCGRTPNTRGWAVDHDHGCCPTHPTCGKCVRGILCHNCNLALGLLEDSVETLLAMVAYLGKEV